jgi:hypothetical protein
VILRGHIPHKRIPVNSYSSYRIAILFLNWEGPLVSFLTFCYFARKISGLEEAAAKKIRQEQQRLKQEEKQKNYLIERI